MTRLALVPQEHIVGGKDTIMPPFITANFVNAEGNDVTKAFIDYAAPIVGELPKIGRFKSVKVAKK